MRIALKFAYDGRNYYGFARQPKLKTIEGKILDILIFEKIIDDPISSQYRIASRTDKGVSSFGNVIAFNTKIKKEDLLGKINKNLDIIFYGLKQVDDDFYPRYAKLRHYRYFLKKEGIDNEKLTCSASLFTGTHNFTNFARVEKGKNPERTIKNIVISEENNYFLIDFYAQTFLWNQIRRIVSCMAQSSKNKIDIKHIKKALENPDDKKDFGVVSAEPLILMDVLYDFEFLYEDEQLKKLGEIKEKIILNL